MLVADRWALPYLRLGLRWFHWQKVQVLLLLQEPTTVLLLLLLLRASARCPSASAHRPRQQLPPVSVVVGPTWFVSFRYYAQWFNKSYPRQNYRNSHFFQYPIYSYLSSNEHSRGTSAERLMTLTFMLVFCEEPHTTRGHQQRSERESYVNYTYSCWQGRQDFALCT